MVVDRQPHLQLDRPDVVEHGFHAAAVFGHPVGNLFVVADRCGEADELDRAWRLDDDLLPDRSAWEVVDVVDLVEDDVADQVQALGVLVDQVAQDLGRHHDDGRVVIDGVLTRDEADLGFAVLAHEVVVFLIAQGFERCCVQSLFAILQGSEDRVLGDHSLAARRRCADQHAASTSLQLVNRLSLERIELERQPGLELIQSILIARVRRAHQSRTSSVDTLVMRAPSLCDSM